MKVIKEGRKQNGWAEEFKCTGGGNQKGGCGAVLLVEQADLFHTYTSYMGRDEEWFVTFKCPECGVLTDIPESQSPVFARELPSQSEWKKLK